jgi:hypothetical protein
MENPFKPQARKRDPAAFLKAPVIKPATQKTRARYTALQQSLLDRQIPPRMVRYITQHFHARAKVDAFIELYHRGCHLTGRPFSDRYDSKDPKPDACVPRKDGTLVCLAAWILTHEGTLPDALLLAAARSLIAHADRRPAQRPAPTTTPHKQPTPEPTYAAASFLSLEPGHQEHSQPSYSAGQPEPAITGHVPVRWEWSDDTNSMVSVAIEPVSHAK